MDTLRSFVIIIKASYIRHTASTWVPFVLYPRPEGLEGQTL